MCLVFVVYLFIQLANVDANVVYLASSDYMAVNVQETLNNSESTVCVTVSTNTDNRTDESSETFRVRLTSDVSPPVVIISPNVTTVIISKT